MVYLNGLCLDECPVGFTETKGRKCVESGEWKVKIVNKMSGLVAINKDVSIDASVSA